jgi:tetratricopeptide (TPR) repeat protein
LETGAGLDPKLAQIATTFFSVRKGLIVDTNGASRAGIAKTLVEMGAKTSSFTLLADFADAVEAIRNIKPLIVVVDFDISGRCGLDLVHVMREAGIENKDSIFVVVTGNASQSAVAQAAEEEVDAYILKPYTLLQFKKVLATVAAGKLSPSRYVQQISEGKRLQAEGKYDEAIATFSEATNLDPKPSLAYYYRGVTELEAKQFEAAEASFTRGLTYNDIHYKCLTGLFDLLLAQRKFPEAYGIAQKITQHFPLSPNRLGQTLKLSVITGHYEDIDSFYEMFKGLDTRSEELVKYVCAALVIGGKAFFKSAKKEKAIDFLRKASVTAAGRPAILRDIVFLFLEQKESNEAELVLKRFANSDVTSQEYLCSKLAVDNFLTSDPRMAIHYARSAITQGLKDPFAYDIIIKRYLELGNKEKAIEWAGQAVIFWPDKKDQFTVT